MKFSDVIRSDGPTPLAASVGCLAIVASAAMSIAFAPTAAQAISAAVTAVSCTGSLTCVTGSNTSNGIGVLGSSPKGTGTRGNSTSSFGLYGSSTSGIGLEASSSSNTGVLGVSLNANGVVGNTSGKSSVHAGVTGADLATNNGVNDGVLGTTTSGGWGVKGTSSNGALGGVSGVATTGDGVSGASSSSNGVNGTSTSGFGIAGTSSSGDGAYGSSSSGNGVYAASNSGVGLSTTSNSSTALLAVSSTGVGGDVRGNNIAIVGRSDHFPLLLTDASNNEAFFVDKSGNVYTYGSYHTLSPMNARQAATSFTTRSTTPNVEDVGEARLVAGVATVKFDPVFAASIERSATYHVFLTPGGDTHGLYVAAKTPAGFIVRETEGGRGSLAFDYRIVASAAGQAGQRSTLVDTRSLAMPQPVPFVVPARPVLREASKASR